MAGMSSASPRALEGYARRGLAMDGEIRLSAATLRGTLGRFGDACREYHVDVEGLSEALMHLAAEGEALDLWVRRVGQQFELADRSSRPWWRRLLDLVPRLRLPSWLRIELPRVRWAWRTEAGSIPAWLARAASGVLGGVSERGLFEGRLEAALGLASVGIVWPWPPRIWRPPFWWWWDRRFRIMRQVPRFLARIAERILRISLRFWTAPAPGATPSEEEPLSVTPEAIPETEGIDRHHAPETREQDGKIAAFHDRVSSLADGVHIDMDGVFGAQCVDLVKLLRPDIRHTGNAWTYADRDDAVPAGNRDALGPGAVIVWPIIQPHTPLGHVAVVESVNADGTVTIVEQNSPYEGAPVRRRVIALTEAMSYIPL